MTENLPPTARRLKMRMEELGITQEVLADDLGVTQGAISLILTGKTQRSRLLPEIADRLQVSLGWLRGDGEDGPRISAVTDAKKAFAGIPSDFSGKQIAEDDGLVSVHEIDLTFGMGATYLEVPVTKKVRRFDRDWLRDYTGANPDDLFFCQGIGNSMAPYIESHDLLLIDASQKDIRLAEQVWAIAYGNCGAIKRLFPMADGSIKMRCDNPSVPDEVAYDGELHVIGRVVAIVRKM